MWVVRLKARHHLFAKCFWPIYTWRKYTRASTLARQKARFLVRVLDLYVQLRNFRAWSKVHRAKYVPRHMGDAFHAQTLALDKEASFVWWHRWARRKRHLNRQVRG